MMMGGWTDGQTESWVSMMAEGQMDSQVDVVWMNIQMKRQTVG